MDLSALRDKLKALSQANILESELQELPDGTSVRLRLMPQEQESAVNEYANSFDGQQFVDAIKRMTLGYSICEVVSGDEVMDLRGVGKIPTGEVINDREVSVERHVFVRDTLVQNWPEEVNDALYRKYLELKYKITNEIERKIKLESGAQMRAARLESLADTMRGLIKDCIEEVQLDVQRVYDFTPANYQPPETQAPMQARPDETEKEPELKPEVAPVSDPAFERLPEAEQQLILEEQEEGIIPQHPNLKPQDD